MKKLLYLSGLLLFMGSNANAQKPKLPEQVIDVLCECTNVEFSKYSFYLEHIYAGLNEQGVDEFDEDILITQLNSTDSAKFVQQGEAFNAYIESDAVEECLETRIDEDEIDRLDSALENEELFNRTLAYMEENNCELIALLFKIAQLDGF